MADAARIYLNSVKTEFENGLRKGLVGSIKLKRQDLKPMELGSAWTYFGWDVGYALAELKTENVKTELGMEFVAQFLEGYTPVHHIDMA